jgi:hypothetical protein
LGDTTGLLTGTWAYVWHPFVAGFYVPLVIAVCAGLLEAHAHKRAGAPTRYGREYFAVGTELCLGAMSVVVLALVQVVRSALGLGPSQVNALWIPAVMVLNLYTLRIAWESRAYAIRYAQSGSAGVHDLAKSSTKSRISALEVAVSLLVCAGVIALNTAIFQH